MLSERNQTQKSRYYIISLYDLSRKDKFIKTKNKLVVAWGERMGLWAVIDNGYIASFEETKI